jgi:hypothetical protein
MQNCSENGRVVTIATFGTSKILQTLSKTSKSYLAENSALSTNVEKTREYAI